MTIHKIVFGNSSELEKRRLHDMRDALHIDQCMLQISPNSGSNATHIDNSKSAKKIHADFPERHEHIELPFSMQFLSLRSVNELMKQHINLIVCIPIIFGLIHIG